jgi:mono/diheme cytochrome c family protein
MSPETHQPAAGAAGSRATPSRGATVPIWLIVVMALVLYWGALYFDQHGGWFNPQVYKPYQTYAELETYQPKREGPDLTRGKQIFETICALCHGLDAEGKPGQAPPLAGSEWAQGIPERMIRIPMFGLTGPVTVKGQQYNLSMPAMGAALSPDDLASVLTYIRTSFGNKATEVTAAQVSAIKSKVGNRSQPFTADELMAIH